MKKDMRDSRYVKKDMARLVCVSGGAVLVLLCMLVISPWAYQFKESGLYRGGSSFQRLDSLMTIKEYSVALNCLDSMITADEEKLPHFPYFDRFLSDREKYKAAVERAEIYELKWKRIEILKATDKIDALRGALEDYVDVIGYNQDAAKALLKQLNNE